MIPIRVKFVSILIVLALVCMPALGQTTANDWRDKGLALYDQGKYDEAIQAFVKVIEIDSQDVDAWYNKGSALRHLGKYAEAIQAYDKAININPQDSDAWFYKGIALGSLGKYDEAVRAYDKAIDIDPQDSDAWYHKGVALGKLGLTAESNAAFAKADELDFGDLIYGDLIGTNGTTTISPDATGTSILDHSMASNVDESTNSVITKTNTFSSTDSTAYSWLSLGNVEPGTVEWRWYSPDGNLYKTISVDIPPNPEGGYWPSYNVWSYINIAGDYPSDLLGDWHVDFILNGQKLTEYFSIKGYQQQVTAHDWAIQGGDLYFNGKYDEALQAFNEAIEIDPQYAGAWNGKGGALKELGKYDEAIQAYNKAIDIDPQDTSFWNNKGAALNAQGKYEEAIQACNKAIDIDPQYAGAWNNKGVALKHQGKYEEAIQAFDKTIDIDPQATIAAVAWRSKGDALKLLGKTSESDAAYAKAKELGYTG